MAMKIDSGSVFRCKLPPPSAELFLEMARDGYEANIGLVERINRDGSSGELVLWDDLTDEFRDTLIAEAKAMYARLALRAGALVEGIQE